MYDFAIKKDFFKNPDFLKIKKQLLSLEYNPPSPEDTGRLSKQAYWHSRTVETKSEIGDLILSNIKNHFNFKIKKFHNILFTMVGNKPQLNPHIDLVKNKIEYQCLIYISGPISLENGTGFFTPKEVKNNKVSYFHTDHIGFEENKAIFFNSSKVHSPLQTLEKGGWRYSIVCFFC